MIGGLADQRRDSVNTAVLLVHRPSHDYRQIGRVKRLLRILRDNQISPPVVVSADKQHRPRAGLKPR